MSEMEVSKERANRLLGKSQSSDELPKLPEIPARQRRGSKARRLP